MHNLEYKGKNVTILEIIKNKHYKLFINSSFINFYDSEQKAIEGAKRNIDLFTKTDKE